MTRHRASPVDRSTVCFFIPLGSSLREKSFTAYRSIPQSHESGLPWQPPRDRVLRDTQQTLVFSTLQMSDPKDDNKQLPQPSQDLQKQAVADSEERAKQPLPLHEVVQAERTELMQIHGMLRCLTDVLLYADDDDSVMHSDVACVCARLLNECITRLEVAVTHHLQRLVAAATPPSSAPADSGEKP